MRLKKTNIIFKREFYRHLVVEINVIAGLVGAGVGTLLGTGSYVGLAGLLGTGPNVGTVGLGLISLITLSPVMKTG